eukprot:5611763-Prymnesium_polylepis.1
MGEREKVDSSGRRLPLCASPHAPAPPPPAPPFILTPARTARTVCLNAHPRPSLPPAPALHRSPCRPHRAPQESLVVMLIANYLLLFLLLAVRAHNVARSRQAYNPPPPSRGGHGGALLTCLAHTHTHRVMQNALDPRELASHRGSLEAVLPQLDGATADKILQDWVRAD